MQPQLSLNKHASISWTVDAKTHDYAVAWWNELVAVVWRHETTLQGVRDLKSAVSALARRHPNGIAMLTIVSESAPMPSSAARKAIAELLSESSAIIRCSAVVMEGAGFRAAAVRSVVTGLTMLARHEFPHSICDVEAAAKMYSEVLPSFTGFALPPSTVRAAINELRDILL